MSGITKVRSKPPEMDRRYGTTLAHGATSNPSQWASLSQRPLSDIRELTEPSLPEMPALHIPLSNRRQQELHQNIAKALPNRSRSTRSTREQDAIYTAARYTHDDPSSSASSDSPACAVPASSVPQRSSSRAQTRSARSKSQNVSRRPSARARTTQSSPTKISVAHAKHGIAQIPMPATRARVPASLDVADCPTIRHPRVKLEMHTSAPLHVGGGCVQGYIKMTVAGHDRYLRSATSTVPFTIRLPLDTGPPPFESKLARITFLLSATLTIVDQHKYYRVRTSQSICILPVCDPEHTLIPLPAPIVAADDVLVQQHGGCSIFVDVNITNRSKKHIKRLDISLEQDILVYKHAAPVSDTTQTDARVFEHNERAILCRYTRRHHVDRWLGIAPRTIDVRTYNLDVPKGVATIRCGRYFEVRHFLNVSICLAQDMTVAVQLPVKLVHINSLDVPPNAIDPVAEALQSQRMLECLDDARSTAGDAIIRTASQRTAFAAPGEHGLRRRDEHLDVIAQVGKLLDQSPRKHQKKDKKGLSHRVIDDPFHIAAQPLRRQLSRNAATSPKVDTGVTLGKTGTVRRYNISPHTLGLERVPSIRQAEHGSENHRPGTSLSFRERLDRSRFEFKACFLVRSRKPPPTTLRVMASMLSIAMASASPSASIDIPKGRDSAIYSSFSAVPKQGMGLLTPPNSISPHMPAHAAQHLKSPSLLNIVEEDGENEMVGGEPATPPQEAIVGASAPLSVGALSGLDSRAAITPALLAKDFLPAIMLGHGPQPIRHVMGELTHTVPGFSRIPPAKARRIVVAALENRHGGGQNGEIGFYKTGWGRWDAQVKATRDDSISIGDDNFIPGMSVPANFGRTHLDVPGAQSASYNGRSGAWDNMRDDEDMDMDMDVPENEADKMSLDDEVFSSSEGDEESDATDDDDWAAVGPQALRKASLPAPGQPAPPRTNYQALSRPSYSSRRFSAVSDRSIHSVAVSACYSPQLGPLQAGLQTPQEQVAIEALLKMGSI
ncbi:hypothetical protein AMS68_000972 [Peltaster fructicola]|uniref:Arrestin C-terminal-like domain-containing protein n=1 Tax=Peltaster fructicola TaxID=286661 RepID=A0A6H0XLF2_9PEZI|nr:hypothetical protein AMS68_000972 [Peltaster fructicola]